MTGLQAISAQNGWAMAGIGALIVMIGLAILSFTISQLHRIIAFIERRPKDSIQSDETPEVDLAIAEVNLLNDVHSTARVYQPLTAELGDQFELHMLYQILIEENLPHPHLTIRSLRESGFLVPMGEGLFCWKSI